MPFESCVNLQVVFKFLQEISSHYYQNRIIKVHHFQFLRILVHCCITVHCGQQNYVFFLTWDCDVNSFSWLNAKSELPTSLFLEGRNGSGISGLFCVRVPVTVILYLRISSASGININQLSIVILHPDPWCMISDAHISWGEVLLYASYLSLHRGLYWSCNRILGHTLWQFSWHICQV